MMHRLVIFLTALLLLFIWSQQTLARDQNRYTRRGPAGQERMEGIKSVPANVPDLSLISFFVGSVRARPDEPVELKLAFYLPNDSSLFIKAQEDIAEKLYFMKPVQVQWKAGWRQFNTWPSSEVLVPLGLSPERLCILGRLDQPEPGSGVLVPIIFYRNNPPDHITHYEMVFRPGRRLRELKFVLSRESDQKEIWQDLRYELSRKAPVDIKLNMSSEPAGYYRLVVTGEYKNRKGNIPRDYRFFHNPLPELK